MGINSIFKSGLLVQIFIIFLRYLIGFAWVFSSIVKIQGKRFTAADGINSPINSASHLFETLFQSGLYWEFIGWSQLIIGGLLLTQRFGFLGALWGLPIAANIFFITISYEFGNTSIITGLMLVGIILLLLWDYPILYTILGLKKNKILPYRNSYLINNQNWIYLGIIYFIATIILRLFFFNAPGILVGSGILLIIGIIVTANTIYYYCKKDLIL